MDPGKDADQEEYERKPRRGGVASVTVLHWSFWIRQE